MSEEGRLGGQSRKDDRGAEVDEEVVIRFRPTMADYLRIGAQMTRRSTFNLVLAGFVCSGGIGGIALGLALGPLVLLGGLSLLTGAYCVPFAWFGARRRRDLLMAEQVVTADRAGATVASAFGSNRFTWPVFRQHRVEADHLLLEPGTGVGFLVITRDVPASDVARFRKLMTAAGIPEVRTNPLRRVAGFLAGVAAFATIVTARVVIG